jgi:diguanylate cyclase (GGDEF)-like protein
MTNGRDSGVSYGFDETAVERAAGSHGLVDDQVDAAIDEGAADTGEAALEVATEASEPDASDAMPTSTAGNRLHASRAPDRNAARRGATALRREAGAVGLEEAVAASRAPAREKLRLLRGLAAKDRVRAAASRERAAAAKSDAAAERRRLDSVLHGAHLDDLTGALRSEIGRHALALEIHRARRSDGRFVLAFADVEGLKAINLRAGNATGDRVLRTLVATLRSGLRPFDPIVRWGGDVFACGMAGVDAGEAHRRFDEIRDSLYADMGVGISLGVAVLAHEETPDTILERAHALMLEAKRARPD